MQFSCQLQVNHIADCSKCTVFRKKVVHLFLNVFSKLLARFSYIFQRNVMEQLAYKSRYYYQSEINIICSLKRTRVLCTVNNIQNLQTTVNSINLGFILQERALCVHQVQKHRLCKTSTAVLQCQSGANPSYHIRWRYAACLVLFGKRRVYSNIVITSLHEKIQTTVSKLDSSS